MTLQLYFPGTREQYIYIFSIDPQYFLSALFSPPGSNSPSSSLSLHQLEMHEVFGRTLKFYITLNPHTILASGMKTAALWTLSKLEVEQGCHWKTTVWINL